MTAPARAVLHAMHDWVACHPRFFAYAVICVIGWAIAIGVVK